MEIYDLVDALQAHQGQRHSTSCCQASETCSIRRQPHYGIFRFSGWRGQTALPPRLGQDLGSTCRFASINACAACIT